MRQLREVLRQKLALGLSHRKVARSCGVSKGTIDQYMRLYRDSGLSWEEVCALDDDALEQRLMGQPAGQRRRSARHVEPEFSTIHEELKKKGMTLELAWREYAEAHGEAAYSYSQFCARYRDWLRRQPRRMRQVHQAGERLFIDYAGATVPIHAHLGAPPEPAQIFVAVLGASHYTYVEATASQQLPDWLESHVRALEFFGGVPELLVPDNLASAVQRAHRYEPEINPSYAELAAHYGTAVVPARPRRPRDKGSAEVAVQLVERWVLARLRNTTFCTLGELNERIAQLRDALNGRPLQRSGRTRRELFEALERPALQPLPAQPYRYASWHQLKVAPDYHVRLQGQRFSVPHRLVGERVDARVSADSVDLYHRARHVAMHPRPRQAGAVSTEPKHMPPEHRQHQQCTPAQMRYWAESVGPATAALLDRRLEGDSHRARVYRGYLGLRRLARAYGAERLEAACQRAERQGIQSTNSLESMLAKGYDRLPEEDGLELGETDEITDHVNVRGAAYYADRAREAKSIKEG